MFSYLLYSLYIFLMALGILPEGGPIGTLLIEWVRFLANLLPWNW